jgi:DNA-binding response OmpR family regulator
VLRVIRPTLEKLSIEVEVCQEAKKATEILISEKFDAVIVDCDDLQGGLEVLQGLRATPSNKNSVTFALLNGKKTTTQEAFGMGVNFRSAKAHQHAECLALLSRGAEFHGTRAAPLLPPGRKNAGPGGLWATKRLTPSAPMSARVASP